MTSTEALMIDAINETKKPPEKCPKMDAPPAPSPQIEQNGGGSLVTKCAPFYEDVYHPTFFAPLLNLGDYCSSSLVSSEVDSPVSVLSPQLFQSQRSFFPSVPTEETSIVGRERAAKERRKHSRNLKQKKATKRCCNYTSALCEGNVLYTGHGSTTKPFSLVEFMTAPPSELDGEKICPIHVDATAETEASLGSTVFPLSSLGYTYEDGAIDVAKYMQHYTTETQAANHNPEAYNNGDSSMTAKRKTMDPTLESQKVVHAATPVDPHKTSELDRMVLDSTVIAQPKGKADLDESLVSKKSHSGRARKPRNSPYATLSSESLQNNDVCVRHETEAEDEGVGVVYFGSKIRRRPSAKEGAYKREKNKVEGRGPSSRFRGVTKHRRSGRWEAHIWIKEMGRQVYLGGYEREEHAAEAYDIAALKSKGGNVKTNFESSKFVHLSLERYNDLAAVLDSITLDELVMIVRRKSQGFSRGTSRFRGVTHHPSGRWEARIGIPGSKHIYLGLYNDEYEAARWYDRALVRLRGPAAATNFLLSNYRQELTEYQEMQQALLTKDASKKGTVKLGPNFEHWVKFGSQGTLTAEQMDLETGSAVFGSSLRQETVKDADPDAEDEATNQKKQLVAQLIMRALEENTEQEYLPMELDTPHYLQPTSALLSHQQSTNIVL